MRSIPTEAEHPSPGGPAKRRRFRPIYLIAALALILILVVWRLSHGAGAGTPNARGGRGRFPGMTGPLPVAVRPAAKADLNIYLNGLGTVTPLAAVTVRTQINGVLMQVAFQEGQLVKQGDLLAVIDPRPYQVALEQAQGQLMQAEAQLKQAQADLGRYQTLGQQDSIAKQQVEAQQALVAQYGGLVKTDQALVDSANLNLTYCHVTAPVSGRVGLRAVDVGNYVTAGDANGLVSLTQIQPITVIFTLPEDNVAQVAARLKAGASIPVDAFDRGQAKKLASGTLAAIDNQVDPTTGTFRLRAQFANADEALYPNQFVNVRMLVDVDRGAIVIPTSGVERGQPGTYVYVVGPDQTVVSRVIKLGTTEGERVAVISGLKAGESVVTDGADRLKDGMKVIVQSATPGAAPAAGAGPPSAAADPTHRRHRGGNGGAPRPNGGSQP